MDHYKHYATIQKLQRINCTAKTIKAEDSGEAVDKTTANGKGSSLLLPTYGGVMPTTVPYCMVKCFLLDRLRPCMPAGFLLCYEHPTEDLSPGTMPQDYLA